MAAPWLHGFRLICSRLCAPCALWGPPVFVLSAAWRDKAVSGFQTAEGETILWSVQMTKSSWGIMQKALQFHILRHE